MVFDLTTVERKFINLYQTVELKQMKIINNILASFNNYEKGFSAA